MDQHRFIELQYRVEHLHSDGTSSRMTEQRQHHDAADHDIERAWANRRIYSCDCGETVTIVPGGDEAATG